MRVKKQCAPECSLLNKRMPTVHEKEEKHEEE